MIEESRINSFGIGLFMAGILILVAGVFGPIGPADSAVAAARRPGEVVSGYAEVVRGSAEAPLSAAPTALPAPAAAAPSPEPTAAPPTPLPTAVPATATPRPLPTPAPRPAPAANVAPPAAPIIPTAPAAPATSPAATGLAPLESALFAAHNAERAKAGLGALRVDPVLMSVARARASDMAAKNYFDHTSPTGQTAFTLLAAFGYTFSYAGENIAWNDSPDDVSVGVAMSGFMNSASHRAHVLEPTFNSLGIGVATSGNKKYYAVVFAAH